MYKPKTTGDLQAYSRIKKKEEEKPNKLLEKLTRKDFSRLQHKLKSLSGERNRDSLEWNGIVQKEISKLIKKNQKEIEPDGKILQTRKKKPRGKNI